MIQFPPQTHYNKKIPKQRFYENIKVNATQKRAWIDQVNSINWKYKLSPDTLNVPAGEKVKEIQVIELTLMEPCVDVDILRKIDQAIPYHLLFRLVHQDKVQLAMAQKEITVTEKVAMKASRYFYSEWMHEEQIRIPIQGLNLDEVYKNFFLAITEEEPTATSDSLETIVTKKEAQDQLNKQIAILERKMRNEKQFNRQVELHHEIRKLKKQREAIHG